MGLGFLELVVIGVAALVLLGPQRIPEIMRHVAKFYVQLRRTSNDFKSTFDHVVQEAELEIKKEELSRLEQSIRSVQSSITDPLPAKNEAQPPELLQKSSAETPLLRPDKPFGWETADQGESRPADPQP